MFMEVLPPDLIDSSRFSLVELSRMVEVGQIALSQLSQEKAQDVMNFIFGM